MTHMKVPADNTIFKAREGNKTHFHQAQLMTQQLVEADMVELMETAYGGNKEKLALKKSYDLMT